jgi:hypothetical protein
MTARSCRRGRQLAKTPLLICSMALDGALTAGLKLVPPHSSLDAKAMFSACRP